jgi:hypothetical protein
MMRKKPSNAAKIASKVVGATLFTGGVVFVSALILLVVNGGTDSNLLDD